MNPPDEDHSPRSMQDPEVRRRRKEALLKPCMTPLRHYVCMLEKMDRGEVPMFDPFDGGINAQVLFLFQKPGPATSQRSGGKQIGSGFISRNNDDRTAEATHRFMEQAGIPREITILWNVVPWWDGKRDITTPQEQLNGISALKGLIELLPELKAVVCVGKKAQCARPFLMETDLVIYNSDHPSPIVRATQKARWDAIPNEWAAIKKHLDLQGSF